MQERFGWASLKARFVGAAAVLIVLVLAASTFFAYREVRLALVDVAQTRLASAADRLSELLVNATSDDVESATALLQRPDLVALFDDEDPGAEGADPLQSLVDSLDAAAPSRTGIALTTAGGREIVSGRTRELPGLEAAPGISQFVRDGEETAYTVTATGPGNGETLAVLREYATLGGNPQTSLTLRGLIGPDAAFLVGNRDGGFWTDLTAPAVDGPPLLGVDGAANEHEADGRTVFGLQRQVPGTPWIVWVALPATVVYEPLYSFLINSAGIGLLLLLLGMAGAWVVAVRVTRPIDAVAEVATALGQGDLSRRVDVDYLQSAEIARLGATFNTMAEEVEVGQQMLERRVAERTAELERTLAQLQEAQEELVRKEKLATLGELAGGVGHELRNPLGVMTNAVYYIYAMLEDPPGKVREYLEIITEQIHLSEKIVGDLLDFARKRPPQRADVSLAQLTERQIERAGGSVTADAPIEIVRDFPDYLRRVRIDPDQGGQVVLNLISNALQALEASGGGTLTLRGHPADDGVRLEVSDTGSGIDPETARRIFEPLFTTKSRGIGLGLSVSRSLSEANGGTLELVETSAKGTTFAVTFPAVPDADVDGITEESTQP